MKKFFALIFLSLIILLSSCSILDERMAPTIQANVEQTIEKFTDVPTNTPFATFTAFPTYTDVPTYTPYPTCTPKIVIVTPTATNTPIYTPTITETPTETIPPTPTKDPTTMDKGPGFYLVGEDIAPGVWRSQGESDSCYWAVTSKTGSILSNHFGMAGGTMYIPATGYQVELDADCGNWTYLGQ